jgi:hypothetical protein
MFRRNILSPSSGLKKETVCFLRNVPIYLRILTALHCIGIGSNGGFCEHGNKHAGSKNAGIYWLNKLLSAFETPCIYLVPVIKSRLALSVLVVLLFRQLNVRWKHLNVWAHRELRQEVLIWNSSLFLLCWRKTLNLSFWIRFSVDIGCCEFISVEAPRYCGTPDARICCAFRIKTIT